MLAVGFMVGLSGALVPGPMLLATVEASLRRGPWAGPEVVLGHALIELLVAVGVILGVASMLSDQGFTLVSIVGGAALAVFGVLVLRDSRSASLEVTEAQSGFRGNPMVAGVVTSASNPYFWIWWLTAGNGLILDGLRTGLLAAALFVIGHWGADLAWYSVVSTTLGRGRTLMTQRTYRLVLVACGVFLILFGAWFAVKAVV